MNTSRIGGIDGCPAGWLLAATPIGAGLVETFTFSTFHELVSVGQEFAVLAIDIPIGLTDHGPRPPDTAARALLGPRASSVFLAKRFMANSLREHRRSASNVMLLSACRPD